MAKAVFLDRDETLNPDSGYINDPAKFDVYPWVPAALKRLQEGGFKLVLITNQSGIGRGLIEPKALEAIHRKLNRQLQEKGARPIDLIEICPHPPSDGCECRKPKPKLILDAARKLSLNLHESFLIGDRQSDVEAGQAAGLKKSFKMASGNEQDFKKALEEILGSASS
jgi:histidinol-phosphate phosphatase family protein